MDANGFLAYISFSKEAVGDGIIQIICVGDSRIIDVQATAVGVRLRYLNKKRNSIPSGHQ